MATKNETTDDTIIENCNDTGLNVTISPLGTSTRISQADSFLIIIEDPEKPDQQSIETILEVKQLSQTKTLSTHTLLNGELIASFTCDDGNLIEVAVPEGYMTTAGIGSWFGAWRTCVKTQYVKMIKLIKEDPELAQIKDINNSINVGLPVTEAAVAIGAAAWCAKQ